MIRFATTVQFVARSMVPAAILAALAIPSHSASAISIYYADIFVPSPEFGTIRRVGTDGIKPQTLVDTGGGLRAIAVHSAQGKIYWVDANNFVVRRSNLDGSEQEDLVTNGVVFPSAIALHISAGKMYWGDQVSNFIYRANLDGTNVEPVVSTPFHRGIAIDDFNDKIYWSTSITLLKGEIKRANLDGTQIETVVSSLDPEFKPSAIDLDVLSGKIYWSDYVVDVVRRSNLNGTNIENLYVVGANHNPRGVLVDRAAGKLYWGQDIDFDGTGGMIMRMNLDGSNQELVLGGAGLVNYLALGPDPACVGDVAPTGGDDTVDVDDLLAVINAWGKCDNPSNCPADVNGDDIVDVDDLLAVINAWGECK
jgi:hypothetical protein